MAKTFKNTMSASSAGGTKTFKTSTQRSTKKDTSWLNAGRGVYEWDFDSKKKDTSWLNAGRTVTKNNGGVLGGVGYVGASLVAGVGGVFEGIADIVGASAAALSGDKLYAEYLFKKNEVGEWFQEIEDAYNPGAVMDFVGDVGQGIGQSAVMAIPYVGTAAFFAGVGGQGIGSAVQTTGELGLKEIAYGTATGAIEGVLEKLVGSGGKLAKRVLSSKATTSLIKSGVRNGIFKTMLSDAAGEFTEEFISAYTDTLLLRLTGVDKNATTTLRDAVYSGFVGAVSGATMGGTYYGINAAYNTHKGQSIRERGNEQTLLNTAKALIDTVPETRKFRGDTALSSLRGSYNAYTQLNAEQKSGSRGAQMLGEMQAALAQSEIALGVADMAETIMKASEEDRAHYASILTLQTGQTVTADMMKNDTDGVASMLAVQSWVNALMTDGEAMATEREFYHTLAKEKAPVMTSSANFNENVSSQVYTVGDQIVTIRRNEGESGEVTYNFGLGSNLNEMQVAQGLDADTVRRQMDKLVARENAARAAKQQATVDMESGPLRQPTAATSPDVGGIGGDAASVGANSAAGVNFSNEPSNGQGAAQNGVEQKNSPSKTGEGKVRHSVEGVNFTEDKYYARQIDKWENLTGYSYITVGVIQKGSPLNQVGLPDGKLYFDVSKIYKEMEKHGDHVDRAILKQIPDLLNDPIVITEYEPGTNSNTVTVYGHLMVGNSPVAVGVMMRPGHGGNVVTRIRTVHARWNFAKQITDKSVLYLNPNKKETLQWFQARGILNVPLGGTKFGLIRSIAYSEQNVKRENQHSVEEGAKQQTSDDNKSAEGNDKSNDFDHEKGTSDNASGLSVQERAALAGEALEQAEADIQETTTLLQRLRTEARTQRAVKSVRDFERLPPEVRRSIYAMMESAERAGVSERIQRQIVPIMVLDKGLEVRFDSHIRPEGVYTELSDGKALIIVRPDADATYRILTHEFAHELQNQPGYAAIAKAARKAAGKDYDRLRRAVIRDHEAFGDHLDEAGIDAEVEARIIAKTLGNEKFWRRFEEHRGLKGAIHFIRELADRLRAYKTKSADEAAAAAYELADRVSESIRAIGERTAMGVSARGQSGKVQHDVMVLDDGNVYVRASRNVISGNNVSDWRRQITNLFNRLLEGGSSLDIQTVEGDILTITKKETLKKARDNYKQIQGSKTKMSDDEFLVKLHAEAHIDELVEVAQKENKSGKPDNKNHSFAKGGFTYRIAYFQDFDGKYYEITLSIGNNNGVATVYNVGKIAKGTLPSANLIAVVGSKPLRSVPSDNSISQNQKKSTPKAKHSVGNSESERRMEALRQRNIRQAKEIKALRTEKKRLQSANVKKERAFRNAKYLADMVTKRDYIAGSMLENEDMKVAIRPLTKIKSAYQLKKNGGEIRRVVRDFGVAFYNSKNDMFTDKVDSKDADGEKWLIKPQILEDIALLSLNAESDADLTLEEFEAVDRILREAAHIYREYGTAVINGHRVVVKQIAKDIYEDLQISHSSAKGEVKSGAIGWLLKKGGVVNKVYTYQIMDPRSVIRAMEGYSHKGLFSQLFDDVRMGEVNAKKTLIELVKPMEDFLREHKKYEKRLTKGKIIFDGHEMSVGQAISLYELSLRDQAKEHLREGGITWSGADGEHRELKTVTAAQLEDIRRQLTAEDRAYIRLVEEFFNKRAKAVKEEADGRILGYTNTVSGHYFPIKVDNTEIAVDISNLSRVMQQQIMTVYNASFNKNTVKGARNQVIVNNVFDVVYGHASMLANYSQLYLPMSAFSKVYNARVDIGPGMQSTVRKYLERVWKENGKTKSDGFERYMSKLFADLQGVGNQKDSVAKLIEGIRGGWFTATLGLNVGTAAKQITSLPMALAHPDVDMDTFFKAFTLPSGKVSMEEMDKYCALAYAKHYEGGAAKAIGVVDKVRGVGQKMMFMIEGMDRQLTARIWCIAQMQVQKDKGFAIGSEQNKVAAGELAMRIMFDTQSGYTVTERSGAMRSTHEIVRTMTMFTSDAMKHFSRIFDAFGEYEACRNRVKNARTEANVKAWRASKKQVGKVLGAHAASTLLLMAVTQAFKWLYDKDREEGETLIEDVFKDTLSSELGMLPGVSDVASFFIDGYDISHFTYDMINDLLGNFRDLSKMAISAVNGEEVDNKLLNYQLRRLSFNIGSLWGIPVKNVHTTFYGLLKRFDPADAYKYNALFYDARAKDLQEALSTGDMRLATTIYDILLKDKVGKTEEKAVKIMLQLYKAGYEDIVPRNVPDEITVKGETDNDADVVVYLKAAQKRQFEEVYGQASGAVADMISSERFWAIDAEEQADAIKRLYDIYYNDAAHAVAGAKLSTRNVLSALADRQLLAVSSAKIASIESDVDRYGNTVSGSRKAKVNDYVKTLKLSRGEVAAVMYAAGYRGEAVVSALIEHANSLSLSEEQLADLAELLGARVVRGRLVAGKS